LLLDCGDFFRNISAQKHGRPPFVRSDGIRGDVLGCCLDGRPNVAMLWPVLCPNVKGLRPINKSNGMFICFLTAVEETGSEYGLVHPPCAKPPLVSSLGPPGAWMTPSRETNSSTFTFLMTEFLRVLSDFA
jgi:hypothetical protein